MSKFQDKRDDLELFLRECIIGPGAFNKRFFLLKRWEESEFSGKLLTDVKAIDNSSEIIAEVPAYQYGSAILFPETIIKDANKDAVNDNRLEELLDVDNDDEYLGQELVDDENLKNNNTESTSSKNQNYPNTFGIAFAVDSSDDLKDNISIEFNFRTYKTIIQKQCIDEKLGYWVSENQFEIKSSINQYFNSVFFTEEIDGNLFICLNVGITISDYLYQLDYSFLNNYLIENVIPKIQFIFADKGIFEVSNKNGKKSFGFKDETREVWLFSFVEESQRSGETFKNIYSLYDSLIGYIKNELKKDSKLFSYYKELIKSIEIYNQLKTIATDLKTIYKKYKPTPLWISTQHNIEIQLPPYSAVDKVQRGEVPITITGIEDISCSYQYIKQSRNNNNNLYIKLIVVNRNPIELKSSDPPQLNKKNRANKASLFGVELKVKELKENILKPYNPPNLLDFDDEDNFNKLIYRQYKDYGEGYNTSVNWGNLESRQLKFVATEFLPEQETPTVSFIPKRKDNSNRIDGDVLSMKKLSTLSNISNEEVLTSLTSFVNAYKMWIDEKEKELIDDKTLNARELKLLSKQLLACSDDYSRLFRNIGLLRNDNEAVQAFRIMNTAMFMQLHHGIEAKKVMKDGMSPFIPENNSEEFYKSINKNYEWRSFQLAFILLNIDAFVKPDIGDKTVNDVFKTGWPERNEIADLVWFPTGGGKTEAYLGIIAFTIAYRRFTRKEKGFGTTVIMRYTLRLLTLQQFQRATLLICALEVIRKNKYLQSRFDLGEERITIGLFVGRDSLPNTWDQGEKNMKTEFRKISEQIKNNNPISTNLPHTNCPWCGSELFTDKELKWTNPNPLSQGFGINDSFSINCPTNGCAFSDVIPRAKNSLPLRLFDEDIYLNPPTLLFGTVDKFAALSNKVSTATSKRNEDSSRLLGRGYQYDKLPPELIIQDELHLLYGPLGSAVGLFEKGLDELCTYSDGGITVRPKVVTSTATTRNTDKQIFALFNRRAEIFPKQGILSDDSFFASYQKISGGSTSDYSSKRKYIGILPVGKTQVWMQLRVASISLVHRLKFLKVHFNEEGLIDPEAEKIYNYYHTVLSYFNSLKEVGKTQSQLSHYLHGDVNLVTENTTAWSFLDHVIRKKTSIDYSELTGRLTSEEIKTNLSRIERNWSLSKKDSTNYIEESNPPEFVISTNMISVGIDVSRFNTMIINSMPRNIAEYIQATSRVAREEIGIVFTVHHPFRSRDLSHYQRFKEFHEKFYSYVEPISVTPFASKALENYFGMYLSLIIRHNSDWGLLNNNDAALLTNELIEKIKFYVLNRIESLKDNAEKLNQYLRTRESGISSNLENFLSDHDMQNIKIKLEDLLRNRWQNRLEITPNLRYSDDDSEISLFEPMKGIRRNDHWKVGQSLRKISPSTVIKTVQQ